MRVGVGVREAGWTFLCVVTSWMWSLHGDLEVLVGNFVFLLCHNLYLLLICFLVISLRSHTVNGKKDIHRGYYNCYFILNNLISDYCPQIFICEVCTILVSVSFFSLSFFSGVRIKLCNVFNMWKTDTQDFMETSEMRVKLIYCFAVLG